jgi:hypothetical protein
MNEIFADIVTEVGLDTQMTATGYKTQLKNWVNRATEKIYNKYHWRAGIVFNEEYTTTAGVASLYLGKEVDRVIALTQRSTPAVLVPWDIHVFSRQFLDEITSQSNPLNYNPDGVFGVNVQPSASAQIQVLSSAADTRIVRVWGISGGNLVTETITVNGATPVSSANAYTEIRELSISAVHASNILTVRQITSNVTLAKFAPHELTLQYPRYNLQPVPSSALTVYAAYKRRFRRLVNDTDTILIPVVPFVKEYVNAYSMREQRKFDSALILEQKVDAEVDKFVSTQASQEDENAVSIPHVVVHPDDEPLY